MENLKSEHSLVIFIAYIILVNIRPNHLVVDSIVLTLLFGYVLFEKFLKYKALPDIRSEVTAQLEDLKKQQEFILKAQNAKILEVEAQIKETSGAVNKVISMKSMNLAQAVKF